MFQTKVALWIGFLGNKVEKSGRTISFLPKQLKKKKNYSQFWAAGMHDYSKTENSVLLVSDKVINFS